MGSSLLTDKERTKFSAMAVEMIDQQISPALIRTRLADAFGLNVKQVQNALSRHEIKLSHNTNGRKQLKLLSEQDQIDLVVMAKELHSAGAGKDEIRMRVAAKFNIYERSVTTRCLKAGLDIRTDIALANATVYGSKCEESVSAPTLKYADYDPAEDKIIQAAKELRDKKVDVGKTNGQWFLEGRPVNCVQVMIRAGMGC